MNFGHMHKVMILLLHEYGMMIGLKGCGISFLD